MDKFNRIFGNLTAQLIIKLKRYNIESNHLIFAEPRGGSTWLMETIQMITQEPVIWEPLHLGRKNNPFKKLNFEWRQYIPEEMEWEEAKILFSKLFSGNILADKVILHSSLSQVLNSNSLLFKFCRGNALLPWITRNFQFEYIPIYIVRHPFAVVCSQIRHGAWDNTALKFQLSNTLSQHSLYTNHINILDSLTTKEEILTAQWCLSNSMTIAKSGKTEKWLTINYEDLVIESDLILQKILNCWNMEYDITKLDLQKDSSTTQADSPVSKQERLSLWRKYFSSSSIEKMQRILDHFHIDMYSKNQIIPEYT